MRGGLVKAVNPAKRGPSVARRLDEGEHTLDTESTKNTTGTEFWLYWKWDKVAAALGVPDWRIKWCVTCTYRGVTVSLYFYQPRSEKAEPILEDVKRFMRNHYCPTSFSTTAASEGLGSPVARAS